MSVIKVILIYFKKQERKKTYPGLLMSLDVSSTFLLSAGLESPVNVNMCHQTLMHVKVIKVHLWSAAIITNNEGNRGPSLSSALQSHQWPITL